MREELFRNWIENGANRELQRYCGEWAYECDAEDVECDFVGILKSAFPGEEFYGSSGVERVVVWQSDWNNVYKFRFNSVGEKDYDFENICDSAENEGLGDLFLDEEFLGYIEGVRVTCQEKASGRVACETVDSHKMYDQLPKETKSKVNNTYCDLFLTWVYTLYGEVFGDRVYKFVEENGIRDIHTHNFTVFNGKVQVFDAALCG